MSCTHAGGCPLLPLLNNSLRSWRDSYCDSTRGWQSCARYRSSMTGVAVPLALLPNGKMANAIAALNGTGAGRLVAAPVPVRASSGSPFEQAPARPRASRMSDLEAAFAEPPSPDRAAAPVLTPARPAAAASPVATVTPDPPDAPRRGWWTRLVTWMRSPA